MKGFPITFPSFSRSILQDILPMAESLWGTLPSADETKSPKTFLREQATFLAQETSGVLEGEISEQTFPGNSVVIDFSIYCQAIQYRYWLLSLEYPAVHLYPMKLRYTADQNQECEMVVHSEDELTASLRNVFHATTVRKVIAALLREAEAA